MSAISKGSGLLCLLAMITVPASASLAAQPQDTQPQDTQPQDSSSSGSPVLTTVYGTPPSDLSGLPGGPAVEGVISARKGDKMQVTSDDGTSKVVFVSTATKIKSTGGFLGMNHSKLGADSLLNGLPVSVKTVQWQHGLVASEVDLKSKDLKTATMIRNGTSQRFAEQGAAIGENTKAAAANAAAAEALRGRMADIDNYDIKGTTNVYFNTGKWNLSPKAQGDLCAAASQAEATDNALLLVVGYTDSVGSQEYNQVLSERRAGSVVNYLQQACHWKPWRMLSPTGMAEADPTADNSTAAGRAQNRRVSVNILVSKAVEAN